MILITGASGCVGRAIAARFIKAGKRVRLQSRSRDSIIKALGETASKPYCEVVEFELGNPKSEDYQRLVAGCTTVIHCAGVVHNESAPIEDYVRLNLRATMLMAEAWAYGPVDTFVFLSSSAVYGDKFSNAREDEPQKAKTNYGLSKIHTELSLSKFGNLPRTIIVRPSIVFGPGDRGNMSTLIKQVQSGMYFNIKDNPALKSVICSDDLALAIDSLLEHATTGYHVFNAANPKPVGINDLADIISQAVGKSAPRVIPQSLVKVAANFEEKFRGQKAKLTNARLNKLMTTTTLSVSALTGLTGFAPVFDLKEAISRQVSVSES